MMVTSSATQIDGWQTETMTPTDEIVNLSPKNDDDDDDDDDNDDDDDDDDSSNAVPTVVSTDKQPCDISQSDNQSNHSGENRERKDTEGTIPVTTSAEGTSIGEDSDEHTNSSFDPISEIESLGSEVLDSDSETQSHNRKRFGPYSGSRLASAYDKLSETDSACLNFAMEHRIFLKAILGFIAERDQKATQVGMNDPNMIKSGPLKKASHLVSGVWKVKFVEVRRGMFSYYEDAVSEKTSKAGTLLRKNVPLDFNSCSCRAVKIHRKGLNITPGGAIFELKVAGTSRLWWAKSRDERHAWIQAINDAMVGGSVTRGGDSTNEHGRLGFVNSKSPYKDDLRRYLKVKNSLKNSRTRDDYILALKEGLLGYDLDIPVKWLMEQQAGSVTNAGGAFHEETVSDGIEQLRKDLLRDSIRINDELFHGDSGHATERIVGGLARKIVSISRQSTPGRSLKCSVPESKAFAYARDVLLSTNRTRSGGDSYFCIDGLCNNPSLVVTVPSAQEVEPLSVKVELDETEGGAFGYSTNDKTGWIRTRNRMQRSWRKRFFVLSEGTLSFYRNATPRPHGLRGQIVVTDAAISVDRSKEKQSSIIVTIVTKDGPMDRFLCFNNEDKFLAWIYALECTAKGSSSIISGGLSVFRMRATAKDANKSQDVNKSQDSSSSVEQSMKDHVARLGLSAATTGNLDERITRFSQKTSSRLKISVTASTEYNVATIDPQGVDEDKWATISATFLQTFRIDGGRIVRGEETVKVHVSDCLDVVDPMQELNTDRPSCSSPRIGRRKLGRIVTRSRSDV